MPLVTCPECNGSGWNNTTEEECDWCKGHCYIDEDIQPKEVKPVDEIFEELGREDD